MHTRSLSLMFAALLAAAPLHATPDQAAMAAALAAATTPQIPGATWPVLDAAWMNPHIPTLLVMVRDDGMSRDGLARYLCGVIAAHGIRGGLVRVNDALAEDWRPLGEAWCEP